MEIETTDIIYSIVDIETTGGKFNQEKITEIAIFKIKNDGNISVYHQLINPKKKIQLFVKRLTGINNIMLKDNTFLDNIEIISGPQDTTFMLNEFCSKEI